MKPTPTTTPTTKSGSAADSVVVGVRDRRKTLGMSQVKLAITAGCHVNTVRYLEAGGSCDAFTVRKIDDALNGLEAQQEEEAA